MKKNLDMYEMLSAKTIKTVAADLHFWKEEEREAYQGVPKILFMGTGGNPVNLVEQPRQIGGFILYLPGFVLAVDPGPGAVWHARENGVDLRQLDGIYISHGHTDHYLGAPPLIEGMTRVMSRRRGILLLPEDVQEQNLISQYHQGLREDHEGYAGGPEQVITLQAGEVINLTPEITLTPIKAYHGKFNFGFVVETPEMKIGYTSDTSYITQYVQLDGEEFVLDPQAPRRPMPPGEVTGWRDDLKEAYSQVDYLIANVSYFNLFPNRHITAVGLAHLLSGSKVKKCWMTHLDACCTRPESIAQQMAEMVTLNSGVETVTAQDNREDLL